MKRRGFLQNGLFFGLSAVAGSLGVIGFSRLLAPDIPKMSSQHLSLPGALQPESTFIAACIGCGLCAEVCPPRCILFYKRSGGDSVNTPYINPEYRSCTLCGKCMKICPTQALLETPREKVRMGIARIDRSACYPWVDRGVCGACVSVCPLGDNAIRFEFGNLYRPIVEKGCVGCGQCVEVCPEPSLPIRIVQQDQLVPVREKLPGYS